MTWNELIALLNVLIIVPVTAATAVLVFILNTLHQIERRLSKLERNGK